MKHAISFIALSAVVLLSSCVTTMKTARTAETSTSIKNATVADLKVADQRITYTMSPTKAVQRAGLSNVKQAAIQEALTLHGNADVMVEPEFVIEKERGLFSSNISRITVTGRPAFYQNFRTLPDSVWRKPGFYGQPDVVYVGSTDGDGDDDSDSKRGGLLGKLKGRRAQAQLEDIGWRRSGLGVHLTAMGGYEDWTVNSGSSGGSAVLHDYEGHGAYFGGLLTVGYNVTPHWFLGVGGGAYWSEYQNICNVPVFGNVRFNFSGHKPSTWFLDYKAGVNILPNAKSLKNGVMLAFSVGRDFGPFELALQTMYTQSKNNGTQYYGKSYYDAKWDIWHFGLVLGIAL